jgi:hypothetical protein
MDRVNGLNIKEVSDIFTIMSGTRWGWEMNSSIAVGRGREEIEDICTRSDNLV